MLPRFAGLRPFLSLLGGLLAAQLLWGCAAPIDPALARVHVIAVDPEGRPVDVESGDTLNAERFERQLNELLASADRASDARQLGSNEACVDPRHRHAQGERRRIRKLLIHVHGGMNTRRGSLKTARDVIPRLAKETGDQWNYPVFLSWMSGPLSSYDEHVRLLRNGEHYRIAGFLSGPAFLLTDLLRGIADAPRTWFYEFSTDARVAAKVLGRPLPEWRRADLIQGHLEAERAAGREPEYDTGLGDFRRTAFGRGGMIVRWVLTLPLKLLVTPIFLDGMGQPAWDVMQHRAINTLHLADETEWDHEDVHQQTIPAVIQRDPSGGFARFLRQLDLHIQSEAARGVCYELTLVGHSMGAIIWNDALLLFPELPVRDIVYMGAACSVLDAERTLVPFLKAHPSTQFHNLTLHPIAEAEEVNLYELPSRGSLLEWIDNWYSRPTNITLKRLGKWLVAIETIHVFKPVRAQIHLKGFGRRPDSKPSAHGEFNDCPFWRREFWSTQGPFYF
ncbi:MAG: hypothetical protein IPK67_18605 [Planctomycetes bacterium]|nr:hypothetical protein [Planctomycetota bacterium]